LRQLAARLRLRPYHSVLSPQRGEMIIDQASKMIFLAPVGAKSAGGYISLLTERGLGWGASVAINISSYRAKSLL